MPPGRVDDVSNVGAIEPFPAYNEQFGSQQLLRCENLGFDADDCRRSCASNPGIGDDEGSIAHSGNKIHEEIVAMSFGEPDWIADLTSKAMLLQVVQRHRCRFRGEKNIQVFGGTADSGVLLQRESARNDMRNLMLLEKAQYVLIKTFLVRMELRLR